MQYLFLDYHKTLNVGPAYYFDVCPSQSRHWGVITRSFNVWRVKRMSAWEVTDIGPNTI